MSKVAKTRGDIKSFFHGVRLKHKITYIYVEVIDNSMVVQADKYSEIGPVLEEAFKMTYDNVEFVKTSIISEDYVVIEVGMREE